MSCPRCKEFQLKHGLEALTEADAARSNWTCPDCHARFYWKVAAERRPIPPGVSSKKRLLKDGGMAYEFMHRDLGRLGRVVVRSTSDGRSHITCELATDANATLTHQRMEVFEPIAADLMRILQLS